MPDQFSPEFKGEAIEADIKRIAEDLQEHKASPEVKNYSDREILKKSIQAMSPAVNPPAGSPTTINSDDALINLNSAPPGAKMEVENLLSLAFKEGVARAAEEASKSSPFVLDAFHDALTGQLYDEFKKRGIIK